MRRVAKPYAERPEIYRRLSWEGLIQLSRPSSLRQDLQRRILAGERISGPDIIRARGTLKAPKRTDQPALRMAAQIPSLSVSQVSEGTGKTKDMIGKK
jgi:hypothetical protein